jgi:hypothetical protein
MFLISKFWGFFCFELEKFVIRPVIHPSKFFIPEEEDDGRGGGRRRTNGGSSSITVTEGRYPLVNLV